jgi:hypothetical protein
MGIAVNLLYYDRADWPRGVSFILSHILFRSRFAFLSIVNLGLVIWKS